MTPLESRVVFLAGARTGFGAFGGALKDLSATDLGTLAARGALARTGRNPTRWTTLSLATFSRPRPTPPMSRGTSG